MYGSGKYKRIKAGVKYIDYDLFTRYLGGGNIVYVKSERGSRESKIMQVFSDLDTIKHNLLSK